MESQELDAFPLRCPTTWVFIPSYVPNTQLVGVLVSDLPDCMLSIHHEGEIVVSGAQEFVNRLMQRLGGIRISSVVTDRPRVHVTTAEHGEDVEPTLLLQIEEWL